MKKIIYCLLNLFLIWGLIPNHSASHLFAIQKPNGKAFKSVNGDSITVTHSQGNADGNVYVVVDDPSQITDDDYLVFFDQQMYYRNENGEWVSGFPGHLMGRIL